MYYYFSEFPNQSHECQLNEENRQNTGDPLVPYSLHLAPIPAALYPFPSFPAPAADIVYGNV